MAQKRTKATLRADLYALAPSILETAPDFNFDLGLKLLTWAANINRSTEKPKDELFSDPLLLMKTLVDLVGADKETLYAAIIYPAIRPRGNALFDASYLEQVKQLFRDVAPEQYLTVEKHAKKALQIRALDLIATPHTLEKIDDAFNKPSDKELENLIAYFVLSINTAKNESDENFEHPANAVKDLGGARIRMTQWYLRLVDMRLHPENYSLQDFKHAYYYTDKFYAPFCEFLAKQQFKDDPNYSAANERKGFFRLKMAMEEELMLQIVPEMHAQLKEELLKFVRSFDVFKPLVDDKNLSALELFDTLSDVIEDEIKKIIKQAKVPRKFVKIEGRLKSLRSYYQKVRALRDDIHDLVAFRAILDVEGWEKENKAVTKFYETSEDPRDRLPNGNRKREQIEEFGTLKCREFDSIALAQTYIFQVEGRRKDFWANPHDPDNGFRSLNNTYKIFGGRTELQWVPKSRHKENETGSAAHPMHKFMGSKKGERQIGMSTRTAMRKFSQAAKSVVVRTDKDFYIVRKGTTVAGLAARIHTDFKDAATGAVVTNHDPFNSYRNARVSPDYVLKNGEYVSIDIARQHVKGIVL